MRKLLLFILFCLLPSIALAQRGHEFEQDGVSIDDRDVVNAITPVEFVDGGSALDLQLDLAGTFTWTGTHSFSGASGTFKFPLLTSDQITDGQCDWDTAEDGGVGVIECGSDDGGGTTVHFFSEGLRRATGDCGTSTGGVTNEICLDDDSGAGSGIWRCPSPGDCDGTTAWERVDGGMTDFRITEEDSVPLITVDQNDLIRFKGTPSLVVEVQVVADEEHIVAHTFDSRKNNFIRGATVLTELEAGGLIIDTDGDGSTITTDVLFYEDGGGNQYGLFGADTYPASDGDFLQYDAGTNMVIWGAAFALAGGDGIAINAAPDPDEIDVDLITSGGGADIQSPSGLEILGGKLGLLQGCISAQGDVLAWNGVSSQWQCLPPTVAFSSITDPIVSSNISFGTSEEVTFHANLPSQASSGAFFTFQYSPFFFPDTGTQGLISFEHGSSGIGTVDYLVNIENKFTAAIPSAMQVVTTASGFDQVFDLSDTDLDTIIITQSSAGIGDDGIEDHELDRLDGLDDALVDLDDSPTWTGTHTFTAPEIGAATATTAAADNDSTLVATTAWIDDEVIKEDGTIGGGGNLTACKMFYARDINCKTSGGCTTGTPVAGDNFDYKTADFATGADAAGNWEFIVPENLAGASLIATVYWTSNDAACTAEAGTDAVCWAVATNGLTDGEDWDGAGFGDAQGVEDVCLADGDLMISAPTDAITHAWSAGDLVTLNIIRDVDAGHVDCANDGYSGDASLLGVKVCHGTDNAFSGE